MRKFLLGAAAVLAVATPGLASAQTSGHVGLTYSTLDDDDDADKDGILGVDGAVVGNITGSWNAQFDANYSAMDHGSHDDDFTNVNGHVFTRNANWAAGVFAGLDNVGGSTFYDMGVEGQFYLSSFTFGAAYTWADYRNSSGSAEIGILDLNGQWFMSPNTAIGASISLVEDDYESEDGQIYGVSIEHQFAGSPFSIGANYYIGDTEYNGGGDHDVSAFGLFARLNFGTDNLQARANEGASMPGGGSFARENILTW